jgi:CubicO group peptidase (beta-lactamase class C family)
MTTPTLSRRSLLALTAAPVLAQAGSATKSGRAHAAHAGVPAEVAAFVHRYMHAMNSPGMTFALANATGPVGLGTYGFVDVASRQPVTLAHRFQIGSITKSFVGLTLLQLQDEGRLDVQQPILQHLPWLPIDCPFGEIRIHHLLTHTSGMPENPATVSADPGYRIRQMSAPGSRFQYCNWAYDVLGLLIERLDGRSWAQAVAQRILRPLGMNDTAAAITNEQRARIAQSYVPLHDDRPYPRHGPIAPAANITFENAAGSIASTPADMALYMAMLLRRGATRDGRIVSEEAFRQFTTGFTPAPDFGPAARYGYGIAIDDLDGHVRLRHTGGMASFMSAIHLDLTEGVGAFASINAMQGYRPNPVVEYALRVLRVRPKGSPAPPPPPADEAAHVADPAAYAGTYVASDGRQLRVRARTTTIELVRGGEVIALQQAAPDQFIADHPDFALFVLVFSRAPAAGTSAPPPRAIELAHGSDWYALEGTEVKPAPVPAVDLAPYCGTYCAIGSNGGIVRIVQRRGQLWLDGAAPLLPVCAHTFRTPEDPPSATIVEFRSFIDGRAQFIVLPNETVFTTGILQRIRNLDGLAS